MPLLQAREQHSVAFVQRVVSGAQYCAQTVVPFGPVGSHRPLQHDWKGWQGDPGAKQPPATQRFWTQSPPQQSSFVLHVPMFGVHEQTMAAS
jgi:hypothetical protein